MKNFGWKSSESVGYVRYIEYLVGIVKLIESFKTNGVITRNQGNEIGKAISKLRKIRQWLQLEATDRSNIDSIDNCFEGVISFLTDLLTSNRLPNSSLSFEESISALRSIMISMPYVFEKRRATWVVLAWNKLLRAVKAWLSSPESV